MTNPTINDGRPFYRYWSQCVEKLMTRHHRSKPGRRLAGDATFLYTLLSQEVDDRGNPDEGRVHLGALSAKYHIGMRRITAAVHRLCALGVIRMTDCIAGKNGIIKEGHCYLPDVPGKASRVELRDVSLTLRKPITRLGIPWETRLEVLDPLRSDNIFDLHPSE